MAADAVLTFNEDNFKDTISSGVTVVDFWAQWCGPCLMMGPIIDELAGKYAGKAKIGKLNVDENQNIAASYSVMSIPTILIFKDGEIAKQFVGVQQGDALGAAIEEVL